MWVLTQPAGKVFTDFRELEPLLEEVLLTVQQTQILAPQSM